jgi:outer membrane biosynthesis protein TonB
VGIAAVLVLAAFGFLIYRMLRPADDLNVENRKQQRPVEIASGRPPEMPMPKTEKEPPKKSAPVIESPKAAPKRPEPVEEKVYRVGGDVTAPALIARTEPEYTEQARKAGLKGVVVISLLVDKSGTAEPPRGSRARDGAR